MHKDTGRTRKIGELLQRELAVMIGREMNDPRVAQVNLTAVDVAPDLAHWNEHYSLRSSTSPHQFARRRGPEQLNAKTQRRRERHERNNIQILCVFAPLR